MGNEEIIVGHGIFAIRYHQFLGGQDYFYLFCNITIQLKDGKYKYNFSDFRLKYFEVSQGSSHIADYPIENQNGFNENQIKKIDIKVNELISSLEQSMKRSIDDNW